MSTEQSVLVAMPNEPQVRQLALDIVSAAARSEKSEPGDRGDIIRYESLCVQLEALAIQAMAVRAETVRIPAGPVATAGLPLAADGIEDPIGTPLRDRVPADCAQTVRRWVAAGCVVVEVRLAFEQAPAAAATEWVAAAAPAQPWEAPRV